jgi:PAS domain S-box-containing protein
LNARLENRIALLTQPVGDVSGVRFEDLFDLDEIQEIQDAFAMATGVASIITDTEGRPLTRPSNFCRLCKQIIRNTAKGFENCCHSDAVLGQLNPNGPTLQPCLSGGLWDGGTSILVGNRHVANWLVGQVVDAEADTEKLVSYAKEIGADENAFREALAEVTRMPREQFANVCRSLFLLAKQLSHLALQNLQQARFITERRQAEDALRFTQFMVDHAADTILWLHGDGRIFYANKSSCRTLGYRREELLALTIADIDPLFRPEQWRQCWSKWRLRKASAFESIHRTKDGKTFPVEVVVDYFAYRGEEAICAIVRDISERKLAQEERERLLEASRRYANRLEKVHVIDSAILANMDIVALSNQTLEQLRTLIPCDRASIISLDWPRNTSRVVGLYTDDASFVALGQELPLGDLPFANERLDNRPRIVPDLRAITEPAAIEKRLIAEGMRSYVAAPLHTDTALRGVIALASRSLDAYKAEHIEIVNHVATSMAIFFEQSQLRADRESLLNELSQKNKELESLVYVASHDLRSPLVNIQGFGQRLEKVCRELTERLHTHDVPQSLTEAIAPLIHERIPTSLRFIKASADKMDQLITGLLRFSRTGRATLHVEMIDMKAMIEGILATMNFQLQEANGAVEVGDLPPCHGDVEQLNQVFSNLIDNAIKYRDPSRSVRIAISGGVDQGKATYVVSDNGRGIAPEHQSKIWEIFHRLDPQGSTSGEGLGLTLARRIIERHHGLIWLESEIGVGSRFFVQLPVNPVTDDSLFSRGEFSDAWLETTGHRNPDEENAP